jgi:hypothetical protein
MRAKIERVLRITPGESSKYVNVHTESGSFYLVKNKFTVDQLVVTFEEVSKNIHHMGIIEDYPVLQERFMQEGDDVTHLFPTLT